MTSSTLPDRAPDAANTMMGRVTGWLGRPIAYVITTLILLAAFGGTFVANPDRVAPTKDPAYYTWRTEALITEDPVTVLEVEGAFGMFEGGYRVTAPILGGYLREGAGIASLRITVVLMAILPVLVALLLAGFAYRQRKDPLIWHSVALGAGSLLLTPPFVGYLDNVLCLVFLAASLYLIPGTRDSWPARIGFVALLLASGFTHPTTLAFFCVVLGGMAAARVLFRRDLKSVIRDDGPMLASAFAAGVLMVAIWTIGIWGKSASLSESALAPPYGSDFFVDRLVLWIKAMRPALNAPLFLIGLVGLLATTRKKAAEDDLTRISVVWLVPLVGIFGFLAGKAYPYYRFFNVTLAWVLLVGLGVYFAARFFLTKADEGGPKRLALLGVVALLVIVATNFTKGFDTSGWNNASGGWLSASERQQLDALRAQLEDEKGRPVVFVVDDEPDQEFQIWGFTKLSGNTSRYGMPSGEIENAYLYLGSLENYLLGEPTLKNLESLDEDSSCDSIEETYDKVSCGVLEDAQAGIDRLGEEPIVVVAQAFNAKGENAALVSESSEQTGNLFPGAEVWVTEEDGSITRGDERVLPLDDQEEKGGPLDILLALLGLIVMLIPGYLLFRWLFPDGELPEALGMIPALSMTVLSFVAMAVLAVVRSPFSTGIVWACIALSIAIGVVARRSGSRTQAAAPARP